MRGADKAKRAARGTKDTFAGRRPPLDESKLAIYKKMKEDYETLRKNLKASSMKGGKQKTLSQELYWKYMQKCMSEGDGPPAQRFAAGAKSFRQSFGV